MVCKAISKVLNQDFRLGLFKLIIKKLKCTLWRRSDIVKLLSLSYYRQTIIFMLFVALDLLPLLSILLYSNEFWFTFSFLHQQNVSYNL